MRCGVASRAITRRALGRLGPVRRRRLDDHLRGCARCAAEARADGWIPDGLGALRMDPAGREDVRDRVAAEIARLAAPDRSEVSTRELAWASCVAAALGGMLLASLWLVGPQLPIVARHVLTVLEQLGGVLLRLAGVVVPLVTVPLRLLGATVDALDTLRPLLDRVRPVVAAAIVLGYGAMASTICFVVARDLWVVPLRPRNGGRR